MLLTFRLLIFIFLRFYVVRSTKRVFKMWLVSLSQFLLQRDTHYLSTSSKYHDDGGQTKKLWKNSFFPCLIFLSISGTNFYLNVVQAKNIQLLICNIQILFLEFDRLMSHIIQYSQHLRLKKPAHYFTSKLCL